MTVDVNSTSKHKKIDLSFNAKTFLQMVEVMAASSGGVDWSLVLKPFLSPNYECSSTTELIELCSTIVRRYDTCHFSCTPQNLIFFPWQLRNVLISIHFSESEIWRHKEAHKNFYNNFTVLAADYISSSISKCELTLAWLLSTSLCDYITFCFSQVCVGVLGGLFITCKCNNI